MSTHLVQLAIAAAFAAAVALGLWFGFFYDEVRIRTSRRDQPIQFWSLIALFAVNAVAFTAAGLGAFDR